MNWDNPSRLTRHQMSSMAFILKMQLDISDKMSSAVMISLLLEVLSKIIIYVIGIDENGLSQFVHHFMASIRVITWPLVVFYRLRLASRAPTLPVRTDITGVVPRFKETNHNTLKQQSLKCPFGGPCSPDFPPYHSIPTRI